MIKLITPENKSFHTQVIEDMFRLRKRVFLDQLGWDVAATRGMEFDAYDNIDCIYLVSVDATTQKVQGSLRVMPTVGPHLMRDVFAHWFDEPVVFESATIWEVTRFCIDPEFQRGPYTPCGLNLVSSELLIALAELGVKAGLTQVTGLCHRGMMNVLKRTKWPPEIIASSSSPPTGTVYLGLWDISPQVVQSLQIASGLGPQLPSVSDGELGLLAA